MIEEESERGGIDECVLQTLLGGGGVEPFRDNRKCMFVPLPFLFVFNPLCLYTA
jgi:hypothetical protein